MRARAGTAVAALALVLAVPGCETSLADRDAGRRLDAAGADGPISCGALATCHGACVDMTSDPANCGACDRSCVVPGAEAACTMGQCSIGRCDPGRADCNGSLADGCEAELACVEDAACTTTCGTPGAQRCADACAPACFAAEQCNLADDDCDGTCDPAGACRVAVHRAIGPLGHFYTTNMAEASTGGRTVEAYSFFHLYRDMADGTRPLFRCRDGAGHQFHSTDSGCEGQPFEGPVGFIGALERCGSVPLYRMNLPASGDNFYTHSAAERDYAMTLGYVLVPSGSDGIVGWVWLGP
jgi:hypothetical protein